MAYVRVPFLFKVEQYSVIHALRFICSRGDEHSGRLHLLALMSKAAVNMVCTHLFESVFGSFENVPGSRIAEECYNSVRDFF